MNERDRLDGQTRMQIEANERRRGTPEGLQDIVGCVQPTPGLQSVLDQLQLEKPPPTMIDAFRQVVEALQPLHDDAKLRVLQAAAIMLGVDQRGD